MNALNDEQKAQVAAWIAHGATLADVQQRLREEFSLTLTYMETRFLVDDLNLRLQDKEADEDKPEADEGTGLASEKEPPPPAGGVRVTMDQVTQPHALVSGKVTFSDGQTATWLLDQMGRLALDPTTPGYRPSEPDVVAFQQELQRVAQQQGF